MHADLAMLQRDISKLERGVGGKRMMSISHGAEQAAQQLDRVSRYTRQGLEATVGLAADFEDQMGRVSALSTRGMTEGEAAKTVAALSKKARELGATTRYTAKEAAAGMEFLAMAGFDASKQIETMPAVLNLATVGHIEVAKAADIATNIMGGFQMGAAESTKMVDRLSAALTSGNVNMQELGYSMKYAAPVAKGLGQELESMLGWMDVLGDAGIKGSSAGTGTREILNRLASPNKGAKKVFREYGVDLTDKDGNLRDATDILSELGLGMAKSGKGNAELSDEIVKIFGKRHRSAAMVLMAAGAKGIASMDTDLSSLQALLADAGVKEADRDKIWDESLQSRIGRVKESDGLGKQMAEKMDATTKGQWRAFKSALEETGITIGEQVLPILVDIMNELKPVVIEMATWAKQHSGTVKFLAKAGILLVGITAVLSPLLTVLSAVAGLGGLGGRLAGRFLGAGAGLGGLGVAGLGGGFGGHGGGGGGGVRGGFGGGGGYYGGGRRRPRKQRYSYALGQGQHGPTQYFEADLNTYDQQRGWGMQNGALGWQAGRNSPDGVWASPEAAYAQKQREKAARRGARGGRGFRSNSLAGQKYAAEQARRRQQARQQSRQQRRQNRANKKAAKRGAGRNGAGIGSAFLAFGLGEMAGEAVNAGTDFVFGRDATEYLTQGLDKIDDTEAGRGIQLWLRKHYGTSNAMNLGMSDAELNAMHGGITGRRGGAQFLSDLNGPTKEGQDRLKQIEREKVLANDLGVAYEFVRRAREQGVLDGFINNGEFRKEFMLREHLKDRAYEKEEQAKQKKAQQEQQFAAEVRARALSKGWTDEEASNAGKHALLRSRGGKTGGMFGSIESNLGEILGYKLKVALIEGIEEGAKKSTIEAVVPGVDPVTGAEAGG